MCVIFVALLFDFESRAAKDSLTATEMVEDMTVGWSLGNTLDSHDSHTALNNNKITVNNSNYYETLWWNPKTTQEMIDTVKQKGFNTLRIPVTYYNHIDSNGIIDKEWLDRVAQVVNYGLNSDMYVIINMHHDTGKGQEKYVQANMTNIEFHQAYIITVWGQIAEYFKDYDNRLVFEGLNETLDMTAQNPWYGNANSWEAMNMLNQCFVSTVRETGGKNAARNLIVNTYGAQTTSGPLKNFKIPDDSVENHLIVGVHTYVSSEKDIKSVMSNMHSLFVSKGYPVIIGEFGTSYGPNMHVRAASAINFINYGKLYGIKCIWWDDGGNYKLLNRKSNTWAYPLIVDNMMYAVGVTNIYD